MTCFRYTAISGALALSLPAMSQDFFTSGVLISDNAVWINDDGRIGLGTTMPQRTLHIAANFGPTIRLEQIGSRIPAPFEWDLIGTESGLGIQNGDTLSTPFYLGADAPFGALFLTSENVGLGGSVPEGKLHTKGDGEQLVLFENGDGGPVQMRFRSDSQNRRFLAKNKADEPINLTQKTTGMLHELEVAHIYIA